MDSDLTAKPLAWIGIDQSYGGFGFVALTEDSSDEYDCWKFPPTGSDGQRLNWVRETLKSRLIGYERYYSVRIAMEGYAHGAKFGREKLGELGGVVKLAVYEVLECDPEVFAPTVIKKFVTGKGTATKPQMIKAVNERWNQQFTDNNIVDAYAIAQYLKEQHGNS